MSTPINNNGTVFNQVWDNLNQGGYQAAQSHGRPQIQAVNPHNMMYGAQGSYEDHQAYKDMSSRTVVPSATITRPLLPAQTPLMECYSWCNNSNKQHETINSSRFHPQTNNGQYYPQTYNGQYYPQTNNGQYYPQTNNGQYYPQTNNGQHYLQTHNGQYYPQTNNGQYYPQTNNGQYYPQTNNGQYYLQTHNRQYYPQTNNGQYYPQTNNGQYYPQTNNGQYYPQTYNGQYYPQTNNGLVVNNVPYSHQHTTSTSSTSLQNNSYQTSPSSLQIQRTHSQTKHTGSPFAALTRELSTPKEKTPALTYTLRSEPATTPKEKTPALTHAIRSESATTPKEKTPALTYTLRSESATTPKEKTPALTHAIRSDSPTTPKEKTPALTYTLRSDSATTPKEKTPALTHALRSEPATTPKEKTPALTHALRSEPATTPKEKTPALTHALRSESATTPKEKTPALTHALRSESATTPKEKTPALTHALRSEPATTPKEKTPALTYTLRSESATTPKEKTSFTKKRKPAQSRKVPSVRAELALKNISSPKAPSIQERHHEPIPVKDVMLPKPPSVTNIEEAKKLLKEEYKNQLQDIENLRIDKQYERKQKGLWDHTERIEEGARKKEFKDDLCLQLENGNFKIDQCHTPEDINKAFQDQWTSMKTLGVYRHWCLRKAAPNNPLPHYPGRVSIRNTGNSCGPDASIIQLLHSGTMNYFIFRPIKEETDRNNWNDHKNNIDHQKEWQRLYQKILFGSTAGGEIDVPDWIRLDFYGMDGYIQVNSYTGTFFDKDIVWKPKEPLKRLDSPGADTRRKLEERILGDWRACRLHTGSWHYTTLIKDEHDEITSIDSGVVKRKIYNSPRELLDLFLSGRKPYDDPSRIDFWE